MAEIHLQIASDKGNVQENIRPYQDFQNGEKVLVLRPNKPLGQNNKFIQQWTPGYEVLKRVGPVTYYIRNLQNGRRALFHEARLKREEHRNHISQDEEKRTRTMKTQEGVSLYKRQEEEEEKQNETMNNSSSSDSESYVDVQVTRRRKNNRHGNQTRRRNSISDPNQRLTNPPAQQYQPIPSHESPEDNRSVEHEKTFRPYHEYDQSTTRNVTPHKGRGQSNPDLSASTESPYDTPRRLTRSYTQLQKTSQAGPTHNGDNASGPFTYGQKDGEQQNRDRINPRDGNEPQRGYPQHSQSNIRATSEATSNKVSPRATRKTRGREYEFPETSPPQFSSDQRITRTAARRNPELFQELPWDFLDHWKKEQKRQSMQTQPE